METVGPRVLEVKAAGDSIDVDNLTREIQTRYSFALHGLKVDVVERDPAAGNELGLISALADDGEGGGGQLANEGGCLLFGELGPCRRLGNPRSNE